MMNSNHLSVFHHHVIDFAKQRDILIEKALAETRAMGFDGLVTDFGIGNAPNGDIAGCIGILDRVPGLKFTLDTGNFTCFGENPHDAYPHFRSRIAFVHLKDHPLGPDGPDPNGAIPVGDGALDLGRLIRRMLDDGYAGDFAAEHFDFADQEAAMRRSASFCRLLL